MKDEGRELGERGAIFDVALGFLDCVSCAIVLALDMVSSIQ
jgi:hypothetical protein